MRMNRIERSLASDMKAGSAADACKFRFVTVPESEFDADRHGFAQVLAASAASDLGGMSAYRGGKRVPRVGWLKAAGAAAADWGSDVAFDGFMDGPTGDIWLSESLPNSSLAEVVAHEVFHAIKHRGRAISYADERAACEFGDLVSARWDLSPDPYAKLFVVETKADLPRHGGAGSSAFVQDELTLYRVSPRSIPSHVKWVEHRHLTKDGIMRTDIHYVGGSFTGMTETRA